MQASGEGRNTKNAANISFRARYNSRKAMFQYTYSTTFQENNDIHSDLLANPSTTALRAVTQVDNEALKEVTTDQDFGRIDATTTVYPGDFHSRVFLCSPLSPTVLWNSEYTSNSTKFFPCVVRIFLS